MNNKNKDISTNEKPKKLNVIWILGEAIRNYKGNDRFSRYEIIDELIPQGIYFQNIVATAPSTLMSQSSIMTSQPPINLSRTNIDFNFDKSYFPTLATILKKEGYNVYGTTHYAEGRKLMKNIVFPLEKKNLPKGVKNDDNWTSKNVNDVFKKLLKDKLKEPFFLLLNYNNEEETQSYLKETIKTLKKTGLYENSLFIFCPDHGWNDNTKKKIIKRHDYILTDSNIFIHCFIKYPNCIKKNINTMVSSLDITPTILDILNIPNQGFRFKGKSLLQFIQGKETYDKKIFRTDIRYVFQKERAVSLRTDKYKYIHRFDPDEKIKEEFYNIINDSNEKNNLLNSNNLDNYTQKQIFSFREELKNQEKELIKYHENYINYKFNKEINKILKNKEKLKIIILGSAEKLFLKMIVNSINKTIKNYELDIISNEKLLKENINLNGKINYYNINIQENSFSKKGEFRHKDEGRISNKILIHFKKISFEDFNNQYSNLYQKEYDLILIPIDNPFGAGHKDIKKIVNKLKSKNKIYIDYNMNIKSNTDNWFIKGLSLIKSKKNYYLKNPKALLIETKKYISQTNK